MNAPYYPKPHPGSSVSGSQAARLLSTDDYELHYHKGLNHDPEGRVVKSAFEKLLNALNAHTPKRFRDIELGPGGVSTRRLVNPQAGYAADRESVEGWLLRLPYAPEHSGALATTLSEMLELYWMADLRDLPFEQWSTDATVQQAVDELKHLPLYSNETAPNAPGYRSRNLDHTNLFRGGDWNFDDTGEHKGPLLSQFMWAPVPYGMQLFDQRERRRVSGDYVPGGPGPYMTTWAEWLDIQNGLDVGGKPTDLDPANGDELQYIHNMAGLARYVHLDKLYQAYLNAAFILVGHGSKFDRGNPYGKECNELGIGTCLPSASKSRFPKEEGFGTFDVPHVLSLVTEVATRALKAVWYQKWVMNLRMRPEAFAGLIHRAHSGDAAISSDGVKSAKKVLNPCDTVLQARLDDPNGILKRMKTSFGGYLLPMCFKEGSPTHPSYGAGHATVAGACVTILKAFFDGDQPLPFDAVEPDPAHNYEKLRPYAEADAADLTIGSELEKLASNISIGRNMAGVHWRSDHTQSLLLGQRIAVSVLYRQRRDYHERPWSFTFRSFGGHNIEIVFDPDNGREGVFFNKDHVLDFNADESSKTAEAEALKRIF